MITVLVGHRGVGKTSLLNRLKAYFPSSLMLDLDEEIALGERTSIERLFEERGEPHFRELEAHYLHALLARFQNDLSTDVFTAVGAGYKGEIPHWVQATWVRRESDADGRVFVDRPRLNPDLSPYAEFMERAQERESRYRQWAHEESTLLEGYNQIYESEKDYWKDQIGDVGGVLTVLPGRFSHPEALLRFFERRFTWGVQLFELRDDLLSEEQINWVFQHLPKERVLLSLRKNRELHTRFKPVYWDWPLEWGTPSETPPVLSLHDRAPGESLWAFLGRLQGPSILKAAPVVHTFHELWECHEWMSVDPKRRAFLPRSGDGRWRWYRLWIKNRMALNFWREGEGSSPDQPLLLEWLENDFTTRWFAAVLGDPVEHSWTPAYHAEFFGNRGLPVLRIPVAQEQWQDGALRILEKFGLRFAAVTSPLKTQAYQAAAAVTENARKFQAVNTLRWTPQGWSGTNTDEAGLHFLLKGVETKAAAVWGGGGTLAALHAVLPEAQFFSSRTGKPREPGGIDVREWEPEVVIWAVGRSQMTISQWPPEAWRPQTVIDLNYAENSPGREYALRCQAQYRSGLDMFYVQADQQQEFWK